MSGGRERRKAEISAQLPDDPSDRAESLPSTRWMIGIACALAALVFAAIRVLGMRQFGAEDGGITSAIAYMVELGYRPYTELQTTGFPPLFFLLAGGAFKFLGVQWQSLVVLAGTFAAISLVAQSWLLERAGFGRVTALAVATLTQCATLLPLSGWWYNQMTSVVGALFVSAALALVARPRDRGVLTAFAASAVLLSWSKPNVAALLLLGVGAALLLNKRTRIAGPLMLLTAAVVSILGLGLVGVNPVLVLQGYLQAMPRVSSGNFVVFFWINDQREAIRTLLLLAPCALAGLRSAFAWAKSGSKNIRRTGAIAATGAMAMLMGVVAMGTNNDHNLVEVPLIVIGCIALAKVSDIGRRPALKSLVAVALWFSVITLAVVGVGSAYARERIESTGPGLFYEDSPLSPVGGPTFLSDMQTGPAFKNALRDVSVLLDLNPALAGPDAPVYFGPRLLEMYPEFGIAPPKGLPTWWGLYPDGLASTDALLRTFVDRNLQLAVFYQRDYDTYPGSLREVLKTQYDVYEWGSLTLHVRLGASVRLPAGATKAN